jgi:Cys-tRNA(Pro) deacylase
MLSIQDDNFSFLFSPEIKEKPMEETKSLLQEIVSKHPDIEYLKLEKEMPTTALAAEVLGIEEQRIIKTCILKVKEKESHHYVAAILIGTDKLDNKKFAQACASKRFSFATSEEASTLTGYKTGGTPPIGLGKSIQKVFLDKKVLEQDVVYGGGGEIDSLIKIPTLFMEKLNEALVLDISK